MSVAELRREFGHTPRVRATTATAFALLLTWGSPAATEAQPASSPATRATSAPATPMTSSPTTRGSSRPTTQPELGRALLTGGPTSLSSATPPSRPTYADLRIADEDGWTSGLAVGLLCNGPLVLAFASLPVIAGINTLGKGDAVGFFVGDKLITAGAIGAAAAIAEVAGGIYLLGDTRRPRPASGLSREVWDAAFDMGLGVALGVHGLGYVAMGIPLLLMSEDHLEEFLLASKPYRVIGVASIAAGGVLAVVGGAVAIYGWRRGAKLMRRVAVAPMFGRGVAGLTLGGSF